MLMPGQVGQDGHRQSIGSGRARQHRAAAEQHPQHQTGQGPDAGNPELRPRTAGATLQPCHPAEQPQRDALDLDAVPAGHECVGQLVRQQRREESDRGDDGREDVGEHAAAGQHQGEPAEGQPSGDDQDDHQDAGVHADADAGDPAEAKGLAHVAPPSSDDTPGPPRPQLTDRRSQSGRPQRD